MLAARLQDKIQSTWIGNCKVFQKENGPADIAKIRLFKSIEDFRDFGV